MAKAKVDPVLVSILGRALKAITDEMSISMEKTTRSPILCEAKDFVTGLYDAEGRMLEQTENLPILSFSLGPVCRHIADKFRELSKSVLSTERQRQAIDVALGFRERRLSDLFDACTRDVP